MLRSIISQAVLTAAACCSASVLLPTARAQLVLEAASYGPEVLEACPLVAKVSVSNKSDDPVIGPLKEGSADSMTLLLSLVLTDESGRTYAIPHETGIGGPRVCLGPPAILPFRPGAALARDVVIPLWIRTAPPPRWSGESSDLNRCLAPGKYQVHYELYLYDKPTLASNALALTVVAAAGADALARERLHYRHVGFLAGVDPPSSVNDYYKGRGRFAELQAIVEDFPESTYAEWIRFRKLYYHGPVDEAVAYAREHSAFSLSDNLLLRQAELSFGRNEHGRARALCDEIESDFPEGDARAEVQVLKAKLANKP